MLQQLQSAMAADAWNSVACVFTDGDQAMAAALASTMPHSHHLRCRYHLKQNLRARLHKAGVDSVTMDSAVREWEAAASREKEADFDSSITTLMNSYPFLRQYMTDTFPAGRYYANFALNHITTLGSRTTSRVESWNSALKGMLEVDSRTSLSVLFESLRYALSDKDYRSYRKSLDDDARRPAITQARTIDAETASHLTYYSQGIVKTQAGLVANYNFDMVQAANPAIFNVFDRRPAQQEDVRQVTITETTMQCTCGFPLSYLLPCRHVLVVNNHIFNSQFRVSQVGLRCLRAHMPAVRYRPSPPSLSFYPPLDVSVPSFTSTVAVASTNLAAQKARYGQLMGWFTTIASIATEAGHLFGYAARKAEGFCKEMESLVSHSPAVRDELSAIAVDESSGSSVSHAELHPSIAASQMQIVPHRKRARGRSTDKGKLSAVELAVRGMHTTSLTPSQAL